MKKIYILLTCSSTWVSKLISISTKDKYTHSAISFDDNLEKLYGFSRKYTYLPLPANIKIENLNDRFHLVNKQMPCMLLSIVVKDNDYENIKKYIEDVYNNKNKYSFNVLGLIFCRFGIVWKRKNKYFCSQFICEILTNYHIIEANKDASIFRPNDFTNYKEFDVVFVGKLNELKEKIDNAYR